MRFHDYCRPRARVFPLESYLPTGVMTPSRGRSIASWIAMAKRGLREVTGETTQCSKRAPGRLQQPGARGRTRPGGTDRSERMEAGFRLRFLQQRTRARRRLEPRSRQAPSSGQWVYFAWRSASSFDTLRNLDSSLSSSSWTFSMSCWSSAVIFLPSPTSSSNRCSLFTYHLS
jgi:hypothetical protein